MSSRTIRIAILSGLALAHIGIILLLAKRPPPQLVSEGPVVATQLIVVQDPRPPVIPPSQLSPPKLIVTLPPLDPPVVIYDDVKGAEPLSSISQVVDRRQHVGPHDCNRHLQGYTSVKCTRRRSIACLDSQSDPKCQTFGAP